MYFSRKEKLDKKGNLHYINFLLSSRNKMSWNTFLRAFIIYVFLLQMTTIYLYDTAVTISYFMSQGVMGSSPALGEIHFYRFGKFFIAIVGIKPKHSSCEMIMQVERFQNPFSVCVGLWIVSHFIKMCFSIESPY